MARLSKIETEEDPYAESLNFKVSHAFKARIAAQALRLHTTQTSAMRMFLALGLEAMEALHAVPPDNE